MEIDSSGAQGVHLVITSGASAGLDLEIRPAGIRIGRSGRNDVVLDDPLLSRHHCRVFFKPDGALWVADLGSANHTSVNGQDVQEALLRPGDVIGLGDTRIEVRRRDQSETSPGIVDLGLASGTRKPAAPLFALPRRTLFLVLAALVVAAAAAGIWALRLAGVGRPPPVPAVPEPPRDPPLTVFYEKVQATAQNIFRYDLRFEDGKVTIEIDDLANNRHVRKDSRVEKDLIRNIARTIKGSGFFALDETYQGIQPGILDQWSISVTIGVDTHRTRVINREEPDVFKSVRQTLEAFGKNQVGLWAIPFSAEELVKKAEEACALGRKLYDEREIKHGNLAGAVRSFREAEWYLETIEVKPSFFPELRAKMAECEELLAGKYGDQNFLAERATRLKDWEQARRELIVLLEIVPDRSDPRNQEARKKLLDVEARLASQK